HLNLLVSPVALSSHLTGCTQTNAAITHMKVSSCACSPSQRGLGPLLGASLQQLAWPWARGPLGLKTLCSRLAARGPPAAVTQTHGG
ncbi:hypothetical protein KUCAC02_029616, partial [Chaenocephalus aceratus]